MIGARRKTEVSSTGRISPQRIEALQDIQDATLNILDDFNVEKERLEETQHAVLNILEDFGSEKANLEGTQKATLNILEDFNTEKECLKDTQRAVLNILDDLNRSNEELQQAHDVLEARVAERTAELQQSHAQLWDEIGERKKAEEQVKASLREKEVLLREIHHRVKNNLQIIHSMLNLQLSQIRDKQSIGLFKESQSRVYTMALIHEKLYQSESMAAIDLPEYIRSLTANLFLSYGVTGNDVRPKIDVENISLDIDVAIPCALIINELVSNSLKHAFGGNGSANGDAEICVSLRRDVYGSGFTLTVSDNGKGLPAGFDIQHSDTLGLKLVSVLAKQLNGTISSRVSTGEGTMFAISFAGNGDGGS